MATQPIDPNPDSPPQESPVQAPDEIVPGQGDLDHPDSVPVEEPRMPDEIRPGQGDTDQPDAVPPEEPGAPGADPNVSRIGDSRRAGARYTDYAPQRPSLLNTVRSMIGSPS
jgi:hypothetical protein